jgi:hypothetical protein
MSGEVVTEAQRGDKKPSDKQVYALIMADIAMAAAIKTYDRGYNLTRTGEYAPGCVRDRWLESAAGEPLRKRVLAMANAGAGALQAMTAEQLAAAAESYGVPLEPGAAEAMAGYFAGRREAVLRYNR